ncbi:MAG: hypothetical protein HVN35_07395 [Methanobacteriaceae archaeon]|nr:hypothetical protein [Methanobacteriaceae archaeon]
MGYLICNRCGGYYELQDDESPEDFESCRCGGQLFYSETLDKPRGSRIKFYGILSAIIILTILGVSYFAFFMPDLGVSPASSPNVLASDSRGIITKEVLNPGNGTSSAGSSGKKTIAIITGMHPREKLSIRTVNDVINNYELSANEEIVHYNVTVTSNPDNYVTGRSNGEGLVSQYIIPDIKKSNIDLVIICHDHGPGYGKGYYIATPKMDSPSVAIGELVDNNLPEFTYYRATPGAEHGSSTFTVSYPLANLGIRTVVYEMPEWASYNQAYQETKKLVKTCFQGITA